MSTRTALTPGTDLPEYRVRAHNGSALSDNKIHDDTVAKQYGFAGGLVPGVTVYAYMTRPVVDALGSDWLERGAMSVRLLKPFYEGDRVSVHAQVTESGASGAALTVEALNQGGDICAVGMATLGDAAVQPDVGDFPEAPLPATRPPASPGAFATPVLGSLSETWDAGAPTALFLDEIADDHALYRGTGAVAHSGYLIRKANTILAANVVLGPWIHASSTVRHFSLVRHGERLSTRGRVTNVFDKSGHRFVELDVLIVAEGSRPVMLVHHTAIYQVRKVQA